MGLIFEFSFDKFLASLVLMDKVEKIIV